MEVELLGLTEEGLRRLLLRPCFRTTITTAVREAINRMPPPRPAPARIHSLASSSQLGRKEEEVEEVEDAFVKLMMADV